MGACTHWDFRKSAPMVTSGAIMQLDVCVVDILNLKCEDSNCDMSKNDLDCLKCSLISLLCN